MDNDVQIQVVENHFTLAYDVFIFRDYKLHSGEAFDMETNIGEYLDKDKKEWVKRKCNEEMKPFFSFRRGCCNKFFESMFESLLRNGKALNLEEKVEKKMKGELKATKIHLEDMRRMVLKKEYQPMEANNG
jgi:hypothetical protein